MALLAAERINEAQAAGQQLQRILIVVHRVFHHVRVKRVVADGSTQCSHVYTQLMLFAGHRVKPVTPQFILPFEHLDLREVTLVGFSMGGGDVTRYIAKYGSERVAKLALLGSVTPFFLKTGDNPEGVDQSVFDGITAGLLKDRAQFISDFASTFYGINHGQKVSEGVQTQTLNIALLASLKGTLDCVTAFSATDFRPDMAKIDVPTLVIHGDDDQVVPFEASGKRAAAMIKGAELKVYPGAPHGFAVTHAETLNKDLLTFVQG